MHNKPMHTKSIDGFLLIFADFAGNVFCFLKGLRALHANGSGEEANKPKLLTWKQS